MPGSRLQIMDDTGNGKYNVCDLGAGRAVRRRRQNRERKRVQYRAEARSQVCGIGTEWLKILSDEIRDELWRRGVTMPDSRGHDPSVPGCAGSDRGNERGRGRKNEHGGLAARFREKVLSYHGRTGIPASRFGRLVTGDPTLVRRLRGGQVPRLDTADRVLAFMGEAPMTSAFMLEVKAFVEVTRIKEYVFSQQASGNPSFLAYLRRGLMPRLDTVDRVRAWMRANCTPKEREVIKSMVMAGALEPPSGEVSWAAVTEEPDPHEGLFDGYVRLDTKDAAGLVGIAPATLSRYRSEGRGPVFHRLGRRICYLRGDVEAWVRQRERKSGRTSR